MRVLVTGAAGFLGSHLVGRFLGDGHSVVGLDNFFSGYRRNLPDHPRLDVVRHDVCDPWHDEVDVIYHLACPASPVWYQRNAVRTIETAVLGTRNALVLARATGARLVITSTSEVYGDALVSPQPEGYWGNVNPVGVRSMYDEGKRCGEALAAAWVRQYGTDVRVARLFNVYGPRMASGDGRLIPNFITQALRGERLTVYGDGSQTRSFCYVADVVEALVRLGDLPFGRLRGQGPDPLPIINIGNPDERTILSVARDVLGACDREVEGAIEFRELPGDDPRQRFPDIERARERMDWEPRVPYDAGLVTTVEWFRKQGV